MAKTTGINAMISTVLKNDRDTLDFSIFSEITATIQIANDTTTIMADTNDAKNSLFNQRSSKMSNSDRRMIVETEPFFIFMIDRY